MTRKKVEKVEALKLEAAKHRARQWGVEGEIEKLLGREITDEESEEIVYLATTVSLDTGYCRDCGHQHELNEFGRCGDCSKD